MSCISPESQVLVRFFLFHQRFLPTRTVLPPALTLPYNVTNSIFVRRRVHLIRLSCDRGRGNIIVCHSRLPV
jgi:hypothetical protein